MSDYLTERSIQFSVTAKTTDLIGEVETQVAGQSTPDEIAIRFAATETQEERWRCDVGIHVGGERLDSIFRLKKRAEEDASSFNVVMLVPTGIGAEIGGHAGDAAPAATLLASACDTLITHPNVLNASDIIQIPPNALYVEGSVITRLLMGTVQLQPTRANRLLVLLEAAEDQLFTDAAINAVNAARAYYGLRVTEIVTIDPGFKMTSEFSPAGAAAGRVEGLDYLWHVLDSRQEEFDAIAISSVIGVPSEFHRNYYERQGSMVNPWGGVEAMLTHAISLKYHVPAAHSPMFESREIAELDLGVVDPRMAAEVVSITFLQSILRGLQRSPRIATGQRLTTGASIGAEAISCLVIPDGCLGLPTLAALAQRITVIAVRENRNIMRNDLAALPWGEGQYYGVDNYLEAAGLINALRAGLDPRSVRRPLKSSLVNWGMIAPTSTNKHLRMNGLAPEDFRIPVKRPQRDHGKHLD